MLNRKMFTSWVNKKTFWSHSFLSVLAAFLIISGIVIIWVATLRIPDLQSFQDKILAGTTKVYDRSEETVLYNLNKDVKQQVVSFDQISQHIKNATIAIEDEDFYKHSGISIVSIIRSVVVDIQRMDFSQGGSTITQQVIKNSLLTADKRISRKIKEWVLALKLEQVMAKDDILNLYLNGTSYGGNHYGIEEASKNFFGKSSKDVTIAEAAYLAALPQAPSYYSPYGNHRDQLEARKNIVLQKMRENSSISEEEYEAAKAEKVAFKPQQNSGIKAPHFVMYIREYLTQKYGEEVVKNGGLKVVTTLDYELQQKAEKIVNEYAIQNEKNFNASNAGLVAIDPATGHILAMVGSRDYFDEEIDGNFNVTVAHRQPGSTFKPFAYVTAFEKGYTPDTVVFDLPTQFSTACDDKGNPKTPDATCYMPSNYDDKFRGPMSLRNALAQSINIPAIKVLYLAGIKDTLQTARDMGITSLNDVDRYGLTMVLGGGEVSLLEMTGAYGVFAQNGIRNPHTGILKVTDRAGNVLEEFKPNPVQAIPTQPTLLLNNVLYDNNARLALNAAGSPTDFPDREVAVKTGTTNDYRDAWIVGYTPQIVVGTWAGNNDNSAMVRRTSGMIVAPMWRAFMNEVLRDLPVVTFERPEPIDPNLKPILRGIWQGGQTYTIDKSTGKLATDFTPPDLRQEMAVPDVHSILFWVNKADPTGPPPARPENDPQFNLWEPSVRAWASANGQQFSGQNPPTQIDDVHTPESIPRVLFTSPSQGTRYNDNDLIQINISTQSRFPLIKAEYYLNDLLIGTVTSAPFSHSFKPKDFSGIKKRNNELKVVVYDNVQNRAEAKTSFDVQN